MIQMTCLKNLLYGMALGIANVIPGLSAGTLAVIFGVFDRLIASISGFFRDIKGNLKFLIPLGIGMGIGILVFANIFEFLIASYPVATNFFFIGIVLGSFPMLWRKSTDGGFKVKHLIGFAAALAVMIVMYVFSPIDHEVVHTLDLQIGLKLFLSGIVAAFAMIIPGISGSFMLLLLGCYATIIAAVSDLNIPMLIILAAGCGIGVLLGSMIIDKLLKTHSCATYFTILGLVVGSLPHMYPGFSCNLEGIIAVILMILGTVIAYWFSRPKGEATE